MFGVVVIWPNDPPRPWEWEETEIEYGPDKHDDSGGDDAAKTEAEGPLMPTPVKPPTRPTPRACDDAPIVPPPSTAVVEFERTPVLYLPDGRVLVRKAGF